MPKEPACSNTTGNENVQIDEAQELTDAWPEGVPPAAQESIVNLIAIIRRLDRELTQTYEELNVAQSDYKDVQAKLELIQHIAV